MLLAIRASVNNESIAGLASANLRKYIQSDNDTCKQRNPMGELFRDILSRIKIDKVHESFESTLHEQISMLKKIKNLPKKCNYIRHAQDTKIR